MDYEKIIRHERIIRPQISEGFCAPAILAEVIRRKQNREVCQEEIGKIVGCTLKKGTQHKKMIEGLNFFGIKSIAATKLGLDELQKHLDGGSLVIVNWMSGDNHKDDGHYSLLEAVEKGVVILNDPHYLGALLVLRREDFENAWFDIDEEKGKVEHWCLII